MKAQPSHRLGYHLSQRELRWLRIPTPQVSTWWPEDRREGTGLFPGASFETENQVRRQSKDSLAHLVPLHGLNSFAPAHSMLGMMERILWQHAHRTWTIQQVKSEMESRGYVFMAEDPIASMGVAMKKLVDRDKVTVVMRGSGRTPNIYQWKVLNTRAEEPSEEELL